MDDKKDLRVEQEEEEIATVPFYIYEGAMVRAERYFKRLLLALITALALLVINNVAWMYYTSVQYPTEITEETK